MKGDKSDPIYVIERNSVTTNNPADFVACMMVAVLAFVVGVGIAFLSKFFGAVAVVFSALAFLFGIFAVFVAFTGKSKKTTSSSSSAPPESSGDSEEADHTKSASPLS